MVCSNFWKLDKIDKIVISLIFIVVSFFSLFSCFCFASVEDEDFEKISPVVYNNISYEGQDFIYSAVWNLYVFDVSDYKYIRTSGVTRQLYFTDTSDFSIGSVPNILGSVSGVQGEYFDVPQGYNYLMVFYPASAENPQIFGYKTGYSTAIDSLVSSVGLSSLWQTFETSVPYVLIVVAVAFGIYLITRMIKGLSKGKGRL